MASYDVLREFSRVLDRGAERRKIISTLRHYDERKGGSVLITSNSKQYAKGEVFINNLTGKYHLIASEEKFKLWFDLPLFQFTVYHSKRCSELSAQSASEIFDVYLIFFDGETACFDVVLVEVVVQNASIVKRSNPVSIENEIRDLMALEALS